jgi:acetyl-CoA carboxylase biotin carboxylase subunit
LLAKVIAWGHTRDEALARMHRAIAEMRIDGVKTTLPFHQALLRNERFRRGEVHTKFVEDVLLEAK